MTINIGIKAPDRQTAITGLVAKGVLEYFAETKRSIADVWIAKLPTRQFDKAPTDEELIAAIEIVKIDAHDEIDTPETFLWDSFIVAESGFRDPISRVLTAAVLNADGSVRTPAVLDTNFYAVLCTKATSLAQIKNGVLNSGGTATNKFKLGQRAELATLAKEVPARTFGQVSVFLVGDGENELPWEELNRKFL